MKPIVLSVPMRKPRNPLARAAALRHAGAHGCGASARRQQARRELHRELSALPTHSP